MDGFLRITSRDNALIKLVCALQTSAKERKRNNLFVVEGLRVLKDLAENGVAFDKFIVSDSAAKRHEEDVQNFAQNSKNNYILPDSLFEKIADTNSPQGMLALAKIPENSLEIDENGKYIALENLSDPSNLGAISRTAEALGVSGILISNDSCDPYSPKVLRASMGTLLRMPVFVVNDLVGFIERSKLKSYACVVDSDALPINEADFTRGSVILIGNEANGLTEEIKSAADKKVTIKMRGNAESLNAAAAAAIAIWEMVK